MSFRLDHEKLLEKNKAVWTKIEGIKIIELDALIITNLKRKALNQDFHEYL